MPFLIGVAGGTASGKSTVCEKIMEQLGEIEQKQSRVITLSLESFYRNLSEDEDLKARKGQFNFDHPNALDRHLMLSTLQNIKDGKEVDIPAYDLKTHRQSGKRVVQPADVILVEGILTFYFKQVRELFDMKLFVDTDSDTRLSRRVLRDVQELGRSIDKTLYQYTTFVKPAFEEFCLPSKKYADIIIPRGADNLVAIELIVQHIQEILKPNGRKLPKFRRQRTNEESALMMFRQVSSETGTPISPTTEKYTSAH